MGNDDIQAICMKKLCLEKNVDIKCQCPRCSGKVKKVGTYEVEVPGLLVNAGTGGYGNDQG